MRQITVYTQILWFRAPFLCLLVVQVFGQCPVAILMVATSTPHIHPTLRFEMTIGSRQEMPVYTQFLWFRVPSVAIFGVAPLHTIVTRIAIPVR
jgi:hypothetical protein